MTERIVRKMVEAMNIANDVVLGIGMNPNVSGNK